jgi:hypothetical protein
MSASKRFSAIFTLFVVFIFAYEAAPPTPVTLLDGGQGGQISFGTVHGVTTQAQAMSKMLTNIQNTCGEKPQIGRVIQFKGTPTVGVFFTVTDHTKGNKKLAGMVLSAPSGPQQVDAAMLSNDAARIGKSINPMLQQLFGVWHPGGQSTASGSSAGAHSVPVSGRSAPAASLHMVSFPDGSAQVGVPDGWYLSGNSAGGTGGVSKATNGHDLEIVQLNMTRGATSYNNPRMGYGGNMIKIVYPANADLIRGFPSIFNQFWRLLNVPDTQLTVDHAEMMPAPPGQRCVHATGHAKVFAQTYSKTPGELNALLCTTMPNQTGDYLVTLSYYDLSVEFADRDRATAVAILSSFQPYQAVINQIGAQQAAPAIAAIHAIGQRASAQMKSAEDANDIHNEGFRARLNSNTTQYANTNDNQDTRARNNQSFDNYILDQTVVQDNNMYGNGTIGHGTVWNSTADALVKADPNRFEYVPQPNFWQGTDYHQ